MTKVYKKFNSDGILRHYVFWTLLILFILNAVVYLLFINFGVSEILYKKHILILLEDLKGENQLLEGRYMEKFKKLSLDYAYNLGYIDANFPVFISRTAMLAKGEPH